MTTPVRQDSGPVQLALAARLTEAFAPNALQVTNESFMHAVPPGSESHFRVVVVSPEFAGQSPLARHRAVHAVVATEIAGGIHALAVEARTPQEWEALDRRSTPSPQCLGGSKADR